MIDARKRRLRRARSLIGVAFAAVAMIGLAQATEPVKPSVATTPVLKPARPYWIELESPQRAVLEPLADDWERLDSQTKKKWVEIAKRYPRMSTEEQQHTQQRMREWAMLTPDQRRVARDSFARVRAMTPEQRAELVQRYRELPDAKKTELAKEGRASKTLIVPRAELTPSPRRVEIREGAKATPNPAVMRKSIETKTLATTVSPPKPASVPAPAVIAPAATAPTETAPATKAP